MPIYEFYCRDCNTIFNFFSSRVNTKKRPLCPKCGKMELERQMSTFATIGRAKKDDEIMPDIDETKMESALMSMAGEMENINEDDPRQMANFMRKFSQKTGLNLGDGMEEALARMESGEDPDKIEQEMGDLLEGEDPFGMMKKKLSGKTGRRATPDIDETLYEL
jgi:putative FmdB family regulatory protein